MTRMNFALSFKPWHKRECTFSSYNLQHSSSMQNPDAHTPLFPFNFNLIYHENTENYSLVHLNSKTLPTYELKAGNMWPYQTHPLLKLQEIIYNYLRKKRLLISNTKFIKRHPEIRLITLHASIIKVRYLTLKHRCTILVDRNLASLSSLSLFIFLTLTQYIKSLH